MPSNYNFEYNVDIVFCIDCTESMDNILNIVKGRALGLYDDIQCKMSSKGKKISQLRVRLIGFRDYVAYADEFRRKVHPNEPMMVTDFFSFKQDAHKLEVSVKSLYPVGGGDIQEDGLEALAYAIRSQWSVTGDKDRHVIVLWTDAEPHALGYGEGTLRYPKGMAKSFDELTEWWDKSMPKKNSKRLILFAPDQGCWTAISSQWDNSVHYPSKAGDGLQNLDYQTILSCIAESIG